MKLLFAFDSSDSEVVNRIIDQLHIPVRNGDIEIWHREMVLPGANINLETEINLHSSDIVVFFLSASFLSSSYLYEIEEEVIRKVKKKKIRLIPVIVRACIWKLTRFGKELSLQALPRDSKAIMSYSSIDEITFTIAEEILAITKRPEDNPENKPPEQDISGYIDRENFIRQLKNLLAEGKTELVLDILDKAFVHDDKDLVNTVILLKSRYNSALRDQRLGIVTNENINLTKNQILHSILQLIEEIPEELHLSSLEDSNVYLDSIKKTSGFETKKDRFGGLRAEIYNTDGKIVSILKTLREDFEIQKYPEVFKAFKTIEQRYKKLVPVIKSEQFSGRDIKALDEIRDQLFGLVNELQEKQSKETEEASHEDLSTSDVVMLNEAKLIFVGNGEVGKTTIRENLMHEGYHLKKHESTEGLEVVSWDMPLTNTTGIDSFRLNIWDFGGQGQYRAIQQFFCTSQALYIYVTIPKSEENSIKDNYSGRDYWLNFVKMFGKNKDDDYESPVIFVMNKCDSGGNQNIEKKAIQGNFKFVKEFVHVSCRNGQGIDELKVLIEKRLKDTQMLNKSIPKGWFEVKKALKSRANTDDLINFDEYLALFIEKAPLGDRDLTLVDQEKNRLLNLKTEEETRAYLGKLHSKVYYSSLVSLWESIKDNTEWELQVAERIIIEQRADVLIKYLHAIGVILYFPNVASLHNKIILNPDWARQMVYRIFKSSYANSGILRDEDLGKIFTGDGRIYSIDLLKTYNLCHPKEIDGQTTYFIPSLFPVEEPPGLFDFSILPNVVKYRCKFSPIIPAEFLPRLITVLFNNITRNNQFWKFGALLSTERQNEQTSPKTIALVKEIWHNNMLLVNVVGEDWQALLALIVNTIAEVGEKLKNQQLGMTIDMKEEITFNNEKDVIDLSDYRKKEKSYRILPADFDEIVAAKNLTLTPEEKTNQSKSIQSELQKTADSLKQSFLYLAACPGDKSPLRIDREFSSITKALQESHKEDFITITPRLDVRSIQLFHILGRANANYIHFSLHGSSKGYLLFIQENNKEARVDLKEIEDVFVQFLKPENPVHLVCFSACHSFEYAEVLAKHIPYTIGMKGKFPVEAASLFAKTFYTYLFDQGIGAISFGFKQTLRAIKQAGYPPQEKMEVHDMPHFFENNILQKFNF